MNSNSSGHTGLSPLHTAAYDARLEAVQLLLSRGAVCTVRDSCGSTPIHEVCMGLHEKAKRAQILGMLLESGDGVMNAQNDDGETPLHFAALYESPACCEPLLRAGAVVSLSLRDIDGQTPLYTAFQNKTSCQGVLARYANNG